MHIPIKLLCSIFSILMIVETTLSSPLQMHSHESSVEKKNSLMESFNESSKSVSTAVDTVDDNDVSQINHVQANKMLAKMIIELLKSKSSAMKHDSDVRVENNKSTRDVILAHNAELPEYQITSVNHAVDTDELSDQNDVGNTENNLLGLLLLEALSKPQSMDVSNEQLEETVKQLSKREAGENKSKDSDKPSQETLGLVTRLVNVLL